MKTSSLLAALAACALAFPAAAQLAGGQITVAEPVRVSDLALGHPADQAKLQARIRHAAFRACGDASSADLAGRNEVRRCRAQAISLATAQAERALAAQRRPSETMVALGE